MVGAVVVVVVVVERKGLNFEGNKQKMSRP
jgi:hypothetical protein